MARVVIAEVGGIVLSVERELDNTWSGMSLDSAKAARAVRVTHDLVARQHVDTIRPGDAAKNTLFAAGERLPIVQEDRLRPIDNVVVRVLAGPAWKLEGV